MKNQDVVNSWKKGVAANVKNLSTNGSDLYSYGLLIGYTDGYKKVVKDYTKGSSYSVTTSRHVNMAKKVSDVTEQV